MSADLENGFADDAEGVAETVRGAVEAGLAGCSIEDSTGRADEPLYAIEHGRRTHRGRGGGGAAGRLVITGRAENFVVGRQAEDLGDAIARLQAYQEAGADVLYAPRLTRIEDIRSVLESVDRPVNVLAFTGLPPVAELAAAGVSRISVGGWFAFAALAASSRPRPSCARTARTAMSTPPAAGGGRGQGVRRLRAGRDRAARVHRRGGRRDRHARVRTLR